MAVSNSTFQITGMAETLEVFQQLADDIGDKKKTSRILISAVKEAMQPVLQMAKMLAPKNTDLLANSLTITGRRPTNKDKKSKYVTTNDTVIAIVTTRNIPKKVKNKFTSSHAGVLSDYSNAVQGSDFKKITYKKLRAQKRNFYASMGIPYDGRAAANEFGTRTEFGTAHNSPSPFMRPAMESRGQAAANLLGEILMKKIEQYRAKHL
jgi:hypothetical protein